MNRTALTSILTGTTGVLLSSFKDRIHGTFYFDITATNGQETCELKFRMQLELGTIGKTLNWRQIK
jgi:hypothetical protein